MKKCKNYLANILGFIGIALQIGCDSQVAQEEFIDLKESRWYADSTIRFQFKVVDTTQPYNLYYNIRHNLSYPYYNLYVQYQIHKETEKVTWVRKDENLMSPSTGVPLGQGSSDIYSCRFNVLQNHNFKEAGTYIFELKQDMRLDTLEGVSAVGFRLEFANK